MHILDIIFYSLDYINTRKLKEINKLGLLKYIYTRTRVLTHEDMN